MDLLQPIEHLCYVRCNYCNTVLAVRIPYKRMMDSVTVKCGQCSNLSFLSPRPPPIQTPSLDHSATHQSQLCSKSKKRQLHCTSLDKPPSTSTSTNSSSLKAPSCVNKPPEKKHRLPSAYNRFMKEEIQRIKAANPSIPHRDAFSAAAKNWAKYTPSLPLIMTSISEPNNNIGVNE